MVYYCGFLIGVPLLKLEIKDYVRQAGEMQHFVQLYAVHFLLRLACGLRTDSRVCVQARLRCD